MCEDRNIGVGSMLDSFLAYCRLLKWDSVVQCGFVRQRH